MNVLITGGNGFVGSHLAEKLVNNGDAVTLYDIDFTMNTQKITCKKIRGDVLDYPTLSHNVKTMDAVFHFAAVSRVAWGQEDPLTCWKTNIIGALNVFEACRRADNRPVVFYASSREVYGEPQYFPVNEEHPKHPKSIYGMSKLYAEQAFRYYFEKFQLKGLIFRFSNVYGSERDQFARVIPKFMLNAFQGIEIPLYGGNQILDFTFIDDTVSGIFQAYTQSFLDHDLFGEDFHFVTGQGTSISDLAQMIVRIVDSPSKIVLKKPKQYDVHKFVGDPDKANRMLGHTSQVNLNQGLTILKEKLSQNSM